MSLFLKNVSKRRKSISQQVIMITTKAPTHFGPRSRMDFFDKYDTHVDSSVTRGSIIKTDVVLGPSVKEIFRSKFVFPLQVVCTNVYMSSRPKRQRQVI